MEPAKYRPDDRFAVLPQWSRPKAGRTTGGGKHRRPADHHAAMEPTENRPDDTALLWAHLLGEEPQWSRPILGRMIWTIPADSSRVR
jgi:hypothetical protein